MVRNEAATFIRGLIARAWRLAPPATPEDGAVPALPIVIKKGGNQAKVGFRLKDGARVTDHPTMPYVLLDLTPDRMSQTLLHEGGHVIHTILWRRRLESGWTPLPHSTFAVTEPITALAEGFAIHLEALWGHFGSDPAKRAFYDHTDPVFSVDVGTAAEFFRPVQDLFTYSQNWARYQAIRDGTAAFAGHVYAGEYLRSQLDPARNRAYLKSANAMIASEGVVASVLFWIVARQAVAMGAHPRAGLDQPGIAQAEEGLMLSFLRVGADARAKVPYRPDLVDVVESCGAAGSKERAAAVACFLDLTRDITARPFFRQTWKDLYEASVVLDQKRVIAALKSLDPDRLAISRDAARDPTSLRAGIGPVVPVRAPKVILELPGMGATFPLEFDLNTIGDAEMAMLPEIDPAAALRILSERDAKPFTSVTDFEHRTGYLLASLGLVAIR